MLFPPVLPYGAYGHYEPDGSANGDAVHKTVFLTGADMFGNLEVQGSREAETEGEPREE